MSINKKPLTVVLGSAMALTGTAASAGSLFQATDLGAGYMVAAAGDDKKAEHKCGEGKCGAEKTATAGDKKKADDKKAEHKCGEGKCGAAPKPN
ncbi:MAG: hypothetical protein C0434_00670 [Xanthomonadaceae bacterium]|nr:hypothetical protein [Xanthomonadaceae bacterium]